MVALRQAAPLQVKRRCAIYTRKSHEEGLDQEFNSLDAQRESGETYIASQKHEGWVELTTRYDDGGFTGANTERPALKRLMSDIEAGRIDVVVVYKIDRLSRSLIDFVSLLQVFEARNVAFVSVTQQFNTASSMGRLILNILICFAQFERENIAERIRDKMAASRRRGKWVGGVPPYGYDVDYAAKKLVVNEVEAANVRRIFQRFLECGSPAVIAHELRSVGATTKAWTSKTGKVHTGEPMNRAYLYKIFHQRTYIGEVEYKGGVYPGEHPAIIDRSMWDRVQLKLIENHTARGNRERSRRTVPGFLKGIARCGYCGAAMTMTYTKKPYGPTYRYYRCLSVTKGKDTPCPVSQVPAGDLEGEVLTQLRRVFRAPSVIAAVSAQAQRLADDQGRSLGHEMVHKAIRSLDEVWDELFPGEQERIVAELIEDLVVRLDESVLRLRIHGLTHLTSELRGTRDLTIEDGVLAVIRLSISVSRRCGRTLMVVPTPKDTDAWEPDALVQAIAQALRWQEELETSGASISEIARHDAIDESYVRRQLHLTFQAPGVIEQMINDRSIRNDRAHGKAFTHTIID